MKNLFLLTSLVLVFISAKAQKGFENQFDSAGKKNGTWIVYYDKGLNEVKDTTKASYLGYIYYANGLNLTLSLRFGLKKCNGCKVVHNDQSYQQIGKIKVLDGEYSWVDKKGVIRMICEFKQGEIQLLKFYNSSGTPNFTEDFTNNWKKQAHSFYVIAYHKKSKPECYYKCECNKPGKGLSRTDWDFLYLPCTD